MGKLTNPKEVLPLKSSVVLHELIEVSHKLVDCLTHVYVSNGGPNVVSIGQRCCFIFVRAYRSLELVPL